MISEIAKGEYYDVQFEDDSASQIWKISIVKEGFAGTVTELTVQQPAIIEYFGNDEDVFDPIKSSRCTFAMVGTNDDEDLLLQQIAESTFLEYGVILYKGSSIVWRGWIYPEQSSRDVRYRASWFYQAGDALALLSTVENPTAVTTVKNVLENLFKEPTTDSKDGLAFGKLYNNSEVCFSMCFEWSYYRRAETLQNQMYLHLAYDGLSYLDLLTNILRLCAARIMQSEGYYQIIHLPSFLKGKDVERLKLFWNSATEQFDETGLSLETIQLRKDLGTVLKSAANFRHKQAYYKTNYLIDLGSNEQRFSFRISSKGWESTSQLIGDVYSNNGSEFTILSTLFDQRYQSPPSYLILTTQRTSGTNNPSGSGTLTKVSGSGPASISFGAVITALDRWIRDFGIELKNSSYYSIGRDLNALQGGQEFAAPKYQSTHILQGGLNLTEYGIPEYANSKPAWFTNDELGQKDLWPGGFTGWTIGSADTSATATARDGLRINVTSAQEAYIYKDLTGLETSTNYLIIVESTNANLITNASWIEVRETSASGIVYAQGNKVFGGGVTGSNLKENAYYWVTLSTAARTSYNVRLVAELFTVSEEIEWVNIRAFKVDDIQDSYFIETLMCQTWSDHDAFIKRIYNLTERSHNAFAYPRIFGNEIILPHSITYNTHRREQSGSWVAIMYNQALTYDPDDISFFTVVNNGLPDSSIRYNTNSSQRQILCEERIRQGWFRLSFKIFADSFLYSDFNPYLDVALYKEEDGPPTNAGFPPKYGFKIEIQSISPTFTCTVKTYFDGLQTTNNYAFPVVIGGVRSELFEMKYDGKVLQLIYNDVILYQNVVDFQDTTETLRYVNNGIAVNFSARTFTLEDLTAEAQNLSGVTKYY